MKIVPAPQFFEGFSRLIRIPQAAICLTVRPKYSIFDRHTDRRTDSPIIGVFWCPFSFPSNTMSMESWCCPAVTTSATSPVASTKTSAAAISSSWPVVFSSVGTCFFLNDFDKFFLTLRRLLRTSIFFLLGVPEKQSLINWSLKKNHFRQYLRKMNYLDLINFFPHSPAALRKSSYHLYQHSHRMTQLKMLFTK